MVPRNRNFMHPLDIMAHTQAPYLAQRFQIDFDNFKQKLEKIKEANKVSIPKRVTKKFYVGSSSVFNPGNTHLKRTVDEAIAEAKQKVEETGDDQFIVQIIRVVRPVKPEVNVQKV